MHGGRGENADGEEGKEGRERGGRERRGRKREGKEWREVESEGESKRVRWVRQQQVKRGTREGSDSSPPKGMEWEGQESGRGSIEAESEEEEEQQV